MSTEDEVRGASRKFYEALNRILNGDVEPMEAIWSHGADVSTMHPLGGRQVGWTEVWALWEQVPGLFAGGEVELRDQIIQAGRDMAFELGVERAQGEIGGKHISAEVRVTNIYRKEAGGWKIIHHHSDLAPEMVDAAGSAQAQDMT